GQYIPLTFAKNAATASDVSIATWTTNDDNQTNIPSGTSLSAGNGTTYFVNRWWDVSPTVALSADITFSWMTTETSTVNYTGTPVSYHWNGSGWDEIVGTAGTRTMTATWTSYS
ncbi:MAG: hypothetical protein COA57_13110, partial [Flavobacteriales bacterium]